jgi:hypothetical protein
MARYQIANSLSGLVLGVYEATSPGDLLESLARDAGYGSAEAMLSCGAEGLTITWTEAPESRLSSRDAARVGLLGYRVESGKIVPDERAHS